MPGRLMMDNHVAEGAQTLQNGQKKADAAGDVRSTFEGIAREGGAHESHKGANDLTNQGGQVKALSNGLHQSPLQLDGSNDIKGNAFTNGNQHRSVGEVAIPSSLLNLPPEIRHYTENYFSLGALFGRVAQLCSNDLLDLINQLSDVSVSSQTNGSLTNGASHAIPGDTSAENIDKKVRWMDFAMTHRDRFIKVLVLSQWSRQVTDVSKLIDLKAWMFERNQHHVAAAHELAMLKAELIHAKVLNPAIRKAFEILSTGEASWLPVPQRLVDGKSYIPPEPLNAHQISKTFRNLNTLLAIKINLHETLPQHLKNWSISSGRATFKIPSEFELDVSIADEDLTSPFFFIDIRFLFSPKPDLPDGPLRIRIDNEANIQLSQNGLSACYDFFHEFVLTHKINVFRVQAAEIAQGLWSDAIKAELNRRVLSVQYWKGVPGPKSWIEFGVTSGKPENGKVSWRGPQPSRLSVRWFRNGVEIKDPSLSIDWDNLSLERVLRHVTSLHIKHMLSSIQDGFMQKLGSNTSLKIELVESELDASVLKFSFANSSETMSISINPITGRYSLQPASISSQQFEDSVNSVATPFHTVLGRLAEFVAWNLEQKIQRQAETFGWTRLRNINIKPDLIKAALKKSTYGRLSWFRGVGWGSSKWAILADIRVVGGDLWYAVELANASVGLSILKVIPLSTTVNGQRIPNDRRFFRVLDRQAAMEICFDTMSRELRNMEAPFSISKPFASAETTGIRSKVPVTAATIFLKFSGLLPQYRPTKDVHRAKPWAADILRLTHHGLQKQQGKILHVVKGMLVRSADLSKVMTSTDVQDVVFNKNGSFHLILRTSFGESCISQLISRLRAVDRILGMVDTVRKENMQCKTVTLARVVVGYNDNLTADVSFADGNDTIIAKFDPANPHRRIQTQLSDVLNRQGFASFVRIVKLTLPALRAVQMIDGPKGNCVTLPSIHIRGVHWYRLDYQHGSFNFTIDVQLRKHRDEMEWHIEDYIKKKQAMAKLPLGRSKGFEDAVDRHFLASGNGWTGMCSVIVASSEGVEEALLKLHELVVQHAESHEDVKPKIEKHSGHEIITVD